MIDKHEVVSTSATRKCSHPTPPTPPPAGLNMNPASAPAPPANAARRVTARAFEHAANPHRFESCQSSRSLTSPAMSCSDCDIRLLLLLLDASAPDFVISARVWSQWPRPGSPSVPAGDGRAVHDRRGQSTRHQNAASAHGARPMPAGTECSPVVAHRSACVVVHTPASAPPPTSAYARHASGPATAGSRYISAPARAGTRRRSSAARCEIAASSCPRRSRAVRRLRSPRSR